MSAARDALVREVAALLREAPEASCRCGPCSENAARAAIRAVGEACAEWCDDIGGIGRRHLRPAHPRPHRRGGRVRRPVGRALYAAGIAATVTSMTNGDPPAFLAGALVGAGAYFGWDDK